LRPFSTYSTKDKLCNLYGFIYNDYTGPKEFKEILAALKILLNQKVIRMKFIGSHGTSLKGMPGEVAGSLARDIAEGLESKEGGYFNSIRASFIKLLKSRKSLDRRLLSSYSITHKINKIRKMWPVKRKSRKPLPTSPSKMDLLKLKTWGIPPTMWTAPKVGRKRGEVSVAIYLDLSGSVTEYLPRIMKKEIQLIFGFSNIVEDHTLNQLRRGEIKTTGGTDFNCIARHLLENKYKKCVIITDGYAYIDQEYKRKVKAQLTSCACILFGKMDNKENWFCACILFGKMDNKENWFSQNFDSFYLDEVVV
jgi:hypothetical protein